MVDDDFRTQVKTVVALAYLPPVQVEAQFFKITVNLLESAPRFVSYFEKVFIRDKQL